MKIIQISISRTTSKNWARIFNFFFPNFFKLGNFSHFFPRENLKFSSNRSYELKAFTQKVWLTNFLVKTTWLTPVIMAASFSTQSFPIEHSPHLKCITHKARSREEVVWWHSEDLSFQTTPSCDISSKGILTEGFSHMNWRDPQVWYFVHLWHPRNDKDCSLAACVLM